MTTFRPSVIHFQSIGNFDQISRHSCTPGVFSSFNSDHDQVFAPQICQQEEEEETWPMTEQLYSRRQLEFQSEQGAGSTCSTVIARSQVQVAQTETTERHRCRPDTHFAQSECALRLGQRVTWFYEGGIAEHGIVRWLGILRGCRFISSDEILAGVEFVFKIF